MEKHTEPESVLSVDTMTEHIEAEPDRTSNDYLKRKSFANGVTLFCVIAACIAVYFLFQNIHLILGGVFLCFNAIKPVIYGLVIAFILNPIVVAFENFFFSIIQEYRELTDKTRSRMRLLSVLLSVILAIWCVYILMKMIIPQTIESIYMLVQDLPEQTVAFSERFLNFIEEKRGYSDTVDYAIKHATTFFNNWVKNDLMSYLTTASKNLASSVFGVVNVVYKFIYNVIIGLIVAIYVLISKERFASQCKKLMYGVFRTSHANTIIHYLRKSNDIFVGFITGKIIDSAIIGVLCFIVTSAFSIPYALLVSFIIGVTNIIPIFGPFIGAIPSCLLVLIVSPIKAVYLAIMIIVIQQLDGNVIGPKILGNSIGISAFWVLFSILLFGNLFGVPGMIVGVPVFAIFYLILKDIIEYILKKKHLALDTAIYNRLDYVELSKEQPDSPVYHNLPERFFNSLEKGKDIKKWLTEKIKNRKNHKKN